MVKKDPVHLSQCLQDLHLYGILSDTREIFLNGDYSNSEGNSVDFKMAVTLEKNLRFLDSIDERGILIHLNSDGGNFADGMAIYDAIKTTKSHVTILAYGEASSMASVILQAADLRVLMPNCHIMIHDGSIDLGSASVKAQLSTSRQILSERTQMLKIYANRMFYGPFNESNKFATISKITDFINSKLQELDDWYIGPEESINFGLADAILGIGKYKHISDLLDI